MSFNQGPQPAVIKDENGVRYIDPNPTNQIVNHEDLVVYVKLVAKSKGRSILTNEGTSTVVENELRNVKSNTNFTYTTGKNYLDTDWTNIGGGPQTLGTDLGGFGITNINIEFKSSFMPQITIDFVDVRGASLFEQGPCSPYSVFFHLPYPVFELTVKGYYGRPVTYTLALVKFTTKFNSETGNFESKGEFVGYTYAFLADIPMGYVMASTYMRGDFNGPKVLESKWKQTVNKPEFADSFYGLNPNVPLTIFDLILKSKKLETQLPQLKNTTEVLEVSQLARVRNELNEFKAEVEEYARELLKIVTISSTSGVRVGAEGSRKTLYYFRLPKNTTTSKRLKDITTLNKKFISTDGPPPTAEGFGSSRIGIKKSTVEGIYAVNKLNDPPAVEFENIKNSCSGLLNAALIQNPDFPDFDEYSIDIWPSLLKPIEEKLTSIDEQYQAKRESVQKQLNNAVREILGFWPSIRNVFAVITSNTEVFLELLAQASDQAETYHDVNDVRANNALSGNQQILDIGKTDGPQSTTDKQPKVYPWPTYYVNLPKPDGNGDAGEKETYPGENAEYTSWPEVRFVEEFVIALTELRVDLENFNISETDGEPGLDNYAPITAFETHAFGEENAPNRWLGIQKGVPGVNELIDSVYCIAGENAFLLGDYSMINALTIWKSQLGLINGWGYNYRSSGFSKDLISERDIISLNGTEGEGYTTNAEANALGIDNTTIAPQRLVDNPELFSTLIYGNDHKRTSRYRGFGWITDWGGAFSSKPQGGSTGGKLVNNVKGPKSDPIYINYLDYTTSELNEFTSEGGTAFAESKHNNWKISEPDSKIGGSNEERAMWQYKISPTTLKRMRVWGRVDALNLLQTLADDGQTDLLIEIQAALKGKDSEQLKDLIKKALEEKHGAKFKKETWDQWKKSATAEINNGTPKVELIDRQSEIWNSYYQYQPKNEVLTLNGAIPLNYSELVGETEIYANPYKNPFGGLRLINDSEINRVISIDGGEGQLVGGEDGMLRRLYRNNYGDVKSESEGGGGEAVASNAGDDGAGAVASNAEGIKTALNFGSIHRKPKYVARPDGAITDYASPYVRTPEGSITLKGLSGLEDEGNNATCSLQLHPKFNMLMYDNKSFRQNFYLDYKSLYKEIWEDADYVTANPDLGLSRSIYSYQNETGGSTEPYFGDPSGLDGKQYADFQGTEGSELNDGSADAFVQTPLWTLNYPANKNPLYGSRRLIQNFEIVNKDLDEANPKKVIDSTVNFDASYSMGGNSAYNVTRNWATWWGINSYYDAGGTIGMDGEKYYLPLAYLTVLSFGNSCGVERNASRTNDDYLTYQQFTGNFIPYDGANFKEEGCFSQFGHTHIAAEPPKAWLLMLGAVLWRAAEGGVLNYEWGGEPGIQGEPGLENIGWNRLNYSRNKNVPDISGNNLQTNDLSDPVWFHHNSISKPRRLNGCIPAINTASSDTPWGDWYGTTNFPNVNEYITASYRRRYLGYDKITGLDRWTDSGGPVMYSKRPWTTNDGGNALTLAGNPPSVQGNHLFAGSIIGPWVLANEDDGTNSYTESPPTDTWLVDEFSYPPIVIPNSSSRAYEQPGYLKSHNNSSLTNGGFVIAPSQLSSTSFRATTIPRDGGPFLYGRKYQKESREETYSNVKNNITQGLFDQCRQDQIPVMIAGASRRNTLTRLEWGGSWEFPHTLVLLDTGDRIRNSTGNTISVDGRTINTVNSPNLTDNAYLNLKERVKELMFLPNQFKTQLIQYFKNWALNEAIDPADTGNVDNWLRIMDPLNFGKKLRLGSGNTKSTQNWKEWGGWPSQSGYEGFQALGWEGDIKLGKAFTFGGKASQQNLEDTPGRFESDEFQKYNPWLISYGNVFDVQRIWGTDSAAVDFIKMFDFSTQDLINSSSWRSDLFGFSFVAGTKIMLANTKTKNIEDISVSDKILSYDIENSVFNESEVGNIETKVVNNLIIIELENGIKLNCTDTHPFYVNKKGWAIYGETTKIKDSPHLGNLDNLFVGDKILYYENNKFKNVKIDKIYSSKQKRVFTIKGVKNNENYIANNVLVST